MLTIITEITVGAEVLVRGRGKGIIVSGKHKMCTVGPTMHTVEFYTKWINDQGEEIDDFPRQEQVKLKRHGNGGEEFVIEKMPAVGRNAHNGPFPTC